MKRALAVIAMLTATLGSAAAAQQVPYPPSTPTPPPTAPSTVVNGQVTLTGSQAAFPPGAPGTFVLSGCASEEPVSFQIYSAAGAPIGSPVRTVADERGSATVQIAVPTTLGSYRVVGTCSLNGSAAWFDFSVATLPKTGSDPVSALHLGAILLGTGGALFVVARVRHRQRAARATL